MPRSLRIPSVWDSIPSETVLDICYFLPAVDLLNLCAAYPDIEQLAVDTSTLWRNIHLPYPDPHLYNYPGWRRRPSTGRRSISLTLASNSRMSERFSERDSLKTIFQDARYRFMTTDDDSEFYGMTMSENSSSQPEFMAWIILDVLDSIPLHFTRHLSFDSPPCHLCVYPCMRFCPCECHQNEQTRRLQESPYQFQHHLNTWHPPQQDQTAPLSQALQNLFESGLVDFSRHIDVRSLNQALTMQITATTTTQPAGISHLSYISQSNNNINIIHEELSLEDALQQLSNIEDEQAALEAQSQHTSSHLSYPEMPVRTYGTYVADMEGTELVQETGHQPSEEEQLEESRQQTETRAAFLRARLLMQILSFRDLGSLETLRAPWWPATRIYTIRQQLEKWSFMVERALATNRGDEETMDQQSSAWAEPTEEPRQGSVPTTRTHWTNRIPSSADANTSSEPRVPSVNLISSSDLSAAQGHLQLSEPTTTTPAFPLASLTRFTLRYGGEVSSNDRHCLGTSAMILSGRSSADSSQTDSPLTQATDPRMSILSDSTLPLSVTQSCKRVFRYCHHCGSQYLHASNIISTLHRACFCEHSTPMRS